MSLVQTMDKDGGKTVDEVFLIDTDGSLQTLSLL